MRRPRPEHQLANDRPNEIWLGFLDDFQRLFAAAQATLSQCRHDVIDTVPIAHGCEIKHVTRLEIPSTVIHLLRDDLGRSFKINVAIPDDSSLSRVIGYAFAANKIDLAYILKASFKTPFPSAT